MNKKNSQRKIHKKIISFENITHSYGTDVILKGVTFDIYQGEFVTILGPSGCGKTTILRMIAGFVSPDAGDMKFEDKTLKSIPTYERPFNTVFQNYALFPTMNVYDNVAYGLKLKKMKSNEIEKEVKTILKKIGMEKHLKKYVNELSGGQKQRVALARALINKPKVLLLDEPLAALDVKIKKEMQIEIKKLHNDLGITFIYVSHDQEEALRLSDTIMIMNEGWIEQIGTPTEIYNEPNNRWVADFVGQANIITNAIYIKNRKIKIDDKIFSCVDQGYGENTFVDVMIRPEDIIITKLDKGYFNGVIKSVLFTGVHYEIFVKTKKNEYFIHTIEEYKVNEKVGIKWKNDAIHVMWKEDYEYAELET